MFLTKRVIRSAVQKYLIYFFINQIQILYEIFLVQSCGTSRTHSDFGGSLRKNHKRVHSCIQGETPNAGLHKWYIGRNTSHCLPWGKIICCYSYDSWFILYTGSFQGSVMRYFNLIGPQHFNWTGSLSDLVILSIITVLFFTVGGDIDDIYIEFNFLVDLIWWLLYCHEDIKYSKWN